MKLGFDKEVSVTQITAIHLDFKEKLIRMIHSINWLTTQEHISSPGLIRVE